MLGENLLFVAIAQVLISGIALYGLFRIGEILFSRTVGWLAGLLYAAYPEFAYWNSVIYTDAYYTSVLVIAVWRILFSKTVPQFIFAIARHQFLQYENGNCKPQEYNGDNHAYRYNVFRI